MKASVIKMNRKGQALIEFILLLPVLVFILLCIIDFGIIFSKNNKLESIINDVVTMYKKSESFETINKYMEENHRALELKIINEENKFISFTLKEEIDILTPGLNLILGDPYLIEIKRVIYYE